MPPGKVPYGSLLMIYTNNWRKGKWKLSPGSSSLEKQLWFAVPSPGLIFHRGKATTVTPKQQRGEASTGVKDQLHSLDLAWKKVMMAFMHSSDCQRSSRRATSLALAWCSRSLSTCRTSCLDRAKDWGRGWAETANESTGHIPLYYMHKADWTGTESGGRGQGNQQMRTKGTRCWMDGARDWGGGRQRQGMRANRHTIGYKNSH